MKLENYLVNITLNLARQFQFHSNQYHGMLLRNWREYNLASRVDAPVHTVESSALKKV